ncbi:hypothetical protein I3F58_03385 [Streptomyces sp. MUM 203J]|uniref:mycothiol-dependent nitroreductase Rv2466c family protein n=1 Tax=Streptomyces sp. MUM 203J TaxID=2791990 RepID=UPI001F033B51|nr:hypothetical protein [Streptomyces sp. MUM 203J]MCH0538616.1 hypothetical protein [Streptomyces sp. MUM 203J]
MSKPTHRTPGEEGRQDVTLWADPLCLWTWVAYKWLREAETVRPLALTVHAAMLDHPVGTSGDDEPSRFRELAPGPVRVLAAVAAERGSRAVRPVYEALAHRFHEVGGLYHGLHDMLRGLSPQAGQEVQAALLAQARDVVEKALADCGLPTGRADAMESPHWDDVLRAAHPAVHRRERGRDAHRLPVISLDGRTCVCVPLLRTAPAGELAGALWDGIAALLREEAFLRRCRSAPAG